MLHCVLAVRDDIISRMLLSTVAASEARRPLLRASPHHFPSTKKLKNAAFCVLFCQVTMMATGIYGSPYAPPLAARVCFIVSRRHPPGGAVSRGTGFGPRPRSRRGGEKTLEAGHQFS